MYLTDLPSSCTHLDAESYIVKLIRSISSSVAYFPDYCNLQLICDDTTGNWNFRVTLFVFPQSLEGDFDTDANL